MCPSLKSGKGNACVNCGQKVDTLYVQYSPGNIRMMKCENCKAIVDPYIECEFMIIMIDLILNKPSSYRHLLYNMLNPDASYWKGIMWNCSLLYILLDACRFYLSKQNKADSPTKSTTSPIWVCEKIVFNIFFGNVVFISFLFFGTRVLLASSFTFVRFKEVMFGIVISSYFKIFVITMMVWEFPLSVLFILDVFVLSSNIVSMKVLTEKKIGECLGVCFCAHIAKFLTNYLLLPLLLGIS